jgi:hypothetical protein
MEETVDRPDWPSNRPGGAAALPCLLKEYLRKELGATAAADGYVVRDFTDS